MTKKMAKIFPGFLLVFVLFTPNLSGQGHFEFGFHYGQWSIDVLRSTIEEGISDALKTNLKDQFLEDLRKDHNVEEGSYNQTVSFDSGGSNFGFELRWYPGGQNGSFSLGLSVEKTTMKVSLPEVSASLSLTDLDEGKSASFKGITSGEFLIKPFSFHFSFRWDISPSWKIHPYITFGFGAAGGTALEEAKYTYSYTGSYTISGEAEESRTGGETKTIKELKDELEAEGEEFFLPGFFPFIQLNLGLKGVISENLQIMVDAGIWDGLLIRGGIAFRF